MLRFNRSLLAASIGAALFVPQTYADDTQDDSVQEMPALDQCLIDEPESDDPNNDPIYVTADSLEAINEDKATYTGDVLVTQGKKTIIADSVVLHQQENIVVAEGNVNFSDGEITAVSSKATNNLNTDEMELENTQYQFLCEPGRGDAVYVSKTGKAMYEIEDGSITSCPEGDNSWRLRASSIDVDQNEEEATFYNPRFEIQSVPVFYLPYLTVPIGDTRKTGFLYPSVSYGSSDGFEAEVPIYFNLAPNYDLTTTIHYMQERGTQLNNEFRYLTDFGSGNLNVEYLHDDAKFEDKGSRWGYQYEHSGIYKQAWKFDIDYSKVSDTEYFSDLDSNVGNREDNQLIQEGSVSYRTNSWDATLSVRDFQVLSTSNLPYRIMPQLAMNYYAPRVMSNLDFDVVSHVTQFETDAEGKPSATRVHVEPGLTVPLSTTWGQWTTEARVLGTYYQQDLDGVDITSDKDSDGNTNPYNGLEENVSRVIPEFRSLAGLVLERDTTVFGGYTQTLEPKVQYLYVPEEDQTNIAFYDTTLLQTDYYGLFRSRKYSGVDFIAPANQLSYGASSRFFDDNYKERLNISFGQIFYIDRDTKNTSSSIDDNEKSSYSSWAIEADFNFNDYLFYHGGVQYDIDTSSMQLANSTLEYRFTEGFIQTNYRYVTTEYIEDTVGFDTSDITNDGISQLGLLGSYQFSPKWRANAQYYYDLTESVNLEWLAAVRYQDDCWYIGLTYTNRLESGENGLMQVDSPEYDKNISINFGIVGFGTSIGSDGTAGGYDDGGNSLGYGRPFFLNN
ncbi:LPS assembly protein LptD [Vibrio maerlii]|uniref:LPS assembly protein LptD n=1 Tax=Vibrio maerlii TaxID=2231648 RepID=UPI000E3E64FF|nr:LPS assembly protein LptD [Vibrio maerlii]